MYRPGEEVHLKGWLRVIGDTIFAFGAVGIGWFVLGLKTGWSFADQGEEGKGLGAAAAEAGMQG